MQYLNKESRLWIFVDNLGLVPVESEYPLLEFNNGEPDIICPYYLYLTDDMRISNAISRYNSLTEEEKKTIDLAVKECTECVDIVPFIDDRHAQILKLYAKEKKILVNLDLFSRFYNFLMIRRVYLDITPCLMIPPIEHDARMRCINQVWIEAFEKYLKETT
jgi:hypothetical protein